MHVTTDDAEQNSAQFSGASSQQEEQSSQGADSTAGRSSDGDAAPEQSSDDEDEDAAVEQLWRPRIRPPDAAEDPRWRLEIAILGGERDGQEVLEVCRITHLCCMHFSSGGGSCTDSSCWCLANRGACVGANDMPAMRAK